MKREVFHTSKAPQAKGPYSQAIIHNEILYVSGQGPVDTATGSIARGSIEAEVNPDGASA